MDTRQLGNYQDPKCNKNLTVVYLIIRMKNVRSGITFNWFCHYQYLSINSKICSDNYELFFMSLGDLPNRENRIPETKLKFPDLSSFLLSTKLQTIFLSQTVLESWKRKELIFIYNPKTTKLRKVSWFQKGFQKMYFK